MDEGKPMFTTRNLMETKLYDNFLDSMSNVISKLNHEIALFPNKEGG
jgi:hypothetical protein